MDTAILPSDRDSTRNDPMRWVLARAMCVEQIDESAATIYLQNSGVRIRIPLALYRVLLQFERPRRLSEVAGSPERAQRLDGPLRQLRDKGFLLDEGEIEAIASTRLLTDPPNRLFDCPAQKPAPAHCDAVVIGVPYDFGDREAAGARDAPLAIRKVSLQMLYAIDRQSGRPRGWFDSVRGCAVLEGISVGDAGDVLVNEGEPQAVTFARLSEALARLDGGGAMPVLIGGDASVSWPVIERLQSTQPLTIVRIGGSVRAGFPAEGFVSAAGLPERALRLAGVGRYLQIGAITDAAAIPAPVRQISMADIRRDGPSAVLGELDPASSIYLGLDMAAVALPSGGHRFDAERFDYDELHALICALGAAHRIVGLDLCGAVPSRPGWNVAAVTALHLLLIAMSAAKDRHGHAC